MNVEPATDQRIDGIRKIGPQGGRRLPATARRNAADDLVEQRGHRVKIGLRALDRGRASGDDIRQLDSDPPLVREEPHGPRPQITMDEPLRMCRLESVEDPRHDPERDVKRNLASPDEIAAQPPPHRLPARAIGHQTKRVSRLADVPDRHEIRMAKAARDPARAEEAADMLRPSPGQEPEAHVLLPDQVVGDTGRLPALLHRLDPIAPFDQGPRHQRASGVRSDVPVVRLRGGRDPRRRRR
jgi:hypothetical protein